MAAALPRAVSLAGLMSSVGLAIFLPGEQWIWTILLLVLGIAYMKIRKK